MFDYNIIIGILLRNMNMYWSLVYWMFFVRENNCLSIYVLNLKIVLLKLFVFLYIFLILYRIFIK